MSRANLTVSIASQIREAETQEQKQKVLEYYSKESLLKRILQYGYSPLVTFGMNDYTTTQKGKPEGMGISKFMHVLEDIYQNKLVGEEARFACNIAMNHINDEESPIFYQMITKTMDLGLEIDTINAVWPDLIIKYPLQMAVESTNKMLKDVEWPASVQEYIHGVRINVIVKNTHVEYRLGDGELMSGLDIYNDAFVKLTQNGSTVLDGSLIFIKDGKQVPEVTEEEILSADPKDLRFTFWDSVRYDGFASGKDTRLGYNWRFNGLEHMLMLYEGEEQPPFSLPVTKPVNSLKEAQQFKKEMKFEKVLIKSYDGIWSNGTTTSELIM